VNHGLDLEERLENLVITGACLSSNEERVALYENRRESRDSVGFVMRGDDSKSVRKSRPEKLSQRMRLMFFISRMTDLGPVFLPQINLPLTLIGV